MYEVQRAMFSAAESLLLLRLRLPGIKINAEVTAGYSSYMYMYVRMARGNLC